MCKLALLLFFILAQLVGAVRAAEVLVAVAANFTAPMQKVAAEFEKDTGHKAVLSFGSTGNFYSQIRAGAPYMLLLSADDETPARLEKEGFTSSGTRFPYATGRLVLWSAQPGMIDDKGEVLSTGDFRHIALANPRLAPYGAAAVETLSRLDLLERLRPRFVQGENIGQTFQFVATGNAALGFVALSQVMVEGRIAKGSAWLVPASLHTPIRQEAVVLNPGKNSAATIALAAYLRGEKSRAIIRGYGYEL
ncbi:MAG: molybdate ABC transporter substrate-binding protein [Ramlibacter sp.]